MKIKLIARLKLMQQFLLSYFMLIIIPLILLSFLTYAQVSDILENYIKTSTQQAFDQTSSFLSYKFFRILDISDIIRNDKNLTTILKKDSSTYDIHNEIEDLDYLRQFLYSFEDKVDITRVDLFINDNFIYSTENVNLYGIGQAKTSTWYPILKKNNLKNLWCPNDYLGIDKIKYPDTLALAATIKDPLDLISDIGYIKINFKKKMVDDIIAKADTINGCLTYIQNSNGIIVDSSNDNLTNKYKISKDLIEKLASKSGTFTEVTINNNKCLVSTSLITNTDWYMTTIIPYSSIIDKIKAVRNNLFALLTIIGTIAFSLAYYFSKTLNTRISKLINAMRKVHNGKLDTYIENDIDDEIGELIDNYNYMINRMTILIDEQYKLGKEVKNAELKALQAQINPHFLYNTLDLINWMSYKNMNKEISTTVKNLAGFYKLSLNKGKDTLSIKDELTHVSLYVQLQNMRYSNRINLIIDVPEEIYDYCILKITLQPIVENSILHGILGKGNENGDILITGSLSDAVISLFIEDNGIGIPKEKLEKILTGDNESRTGSGYGIKNINQRIKLSYGDDFGLFYTSEPNSGTKVEIKLPATKIE